MDWETTLNELSRGVLRSATRNTQGQWQTNTAVKSAILDAFQAGHNIACEGDYSGFIDKHNLLPRQFQLEEGVRMVPGGSAVRPGAYVAPGVIIMPPSYVNIGAYIDSGTMVDSHVLVGSCAQIGKGVHLSAGVQIGGVLEPIGLCPVVVEDHVFIGAGAIVVEGIQVGERAVIAPTVVLSAGVTVYDCVYQVLREKGAPIPPGAVVVPGSRPVSSGWGKAQGLQMACPVIVKYRDDKSDAALNLEAVLR